MKPYARRNKRLYRLTVLILSLVLVAGGGYLAWKHMDYQKGAADYAEAVETAAVPRLEAVPVPERGKAAAPDPNLGLLAEVDLDSLREVNKDVLGWIVIPDTVLSYPLVQYEDNQYYLNHTWQDKRSSVGAIFMECKCAPDFSDFNTIIYGHRMNNESMFGVLHNYKEEDFWRDHPTVYVVTDGGVQVYDIYAALEVGIREIIYHLDVKERDQKQEFIDFGLEHSVISTGIVPAAEGQMLTLSTCTDQGHATRWVVQAVLREAKES